MDRPNVGVAVLIIKDWQLLLGKRKNSHGQGTWGPPGGHLEFGESFENCAKREALEESGIEVLITKKFDCTNDFFVLENKHYVTIFMLACTWQGEPKNLEPEKLACWQWFDLDELPDNLFLPFKNFIEKEDTFRILQAQSDQKNKAPLMSEALM